MNEKDKKVVDKILKQKLYLPVIKSKKFKKSDIFIVKNQKKKNNRK